MSRTVRGAGDSGSGNNPPVRSKFDRSRGKGLKAPHLSHPGEVAKESGSGHAGFMDSGHMMPKDVTPRLGTGSHEHIETGRLGGVNPMDSHRKEGNYLMTDSIAREKGTDSP
jgi:hypothetical protein